MIFQAPGSASPAGVLSFASPKESSQRKGDPWVGAGLRPVPCATRQGGRLAKLACRSDNASRLPPPRLRCSAPLKGARKTSGHNHFSPPTTCCGRPPEDARNEEHQSSIDVFPGPLGGAEQRRSAGGSRRALSEGSSPELRSRPAFRVAQGTRRSRAPTQGWPSFWLLFLGPTRKSTPAAKAEHSASESTPARQALNPTPTRPAAPETNP